MTEGQSAKHTLFNTNIDAIEKAAIVKVASVTVGMQTADGQQALYTVPTGCKFIPFMIVVRDPTGSLAGGTAFGFGDDSPATNWKSGVDLSGFTAGSGNALIITPPSGSFTIYDAADVFDINPATGATADVDATIDVFGWVYDA
jgi:hypothetical protein